MSNSLQGLLRTRQCIVEKIEELNKSLQSIDKQLFDRIGKLAEAFEGVSQPTTPVNQKSFWETLNPETSRRKVRGSSLGAPVTEILRDTGRPMRTKELYEELLKRAVEVRGQRPEANLAAHLSNMEGVVKGPNGWELKTNALADSTH